MKIKKDDLLAINETMLGRGAPVEIDGEGYNVPDYNSLKHIHYGASNEDCANIARRLSKYYETQLKDLVDFSLEDLKETQQYFEEKREGKDSITLNYSSAKKRFELHFKYNHEIKEKCKAFGAKFEWSEKTWSIDAGRVLPLLASLNKLAAVESAIEYAKSVLDGEDIDENIELKKTFEVKLYREIASVTYLLVTFEYEPSIVEVIKMLEDRQYHSDLKGWEVNANEAELLYKKLSELDTTGFDFSPLKTYFSKGGEQKSKLSVKEKKRDLHIMFPSIHPEERKKVSEIIKTLDHYEYMKSYKVWRVDKYQCVQLLERLQKYAPSIDCTELEKVTSKLIEEYKNKYELFEPKNSIVKPFPHQTKAAKFLLTRKRTILADEMGMGKTITATLSAMSVPAPRLVICPASLKLNWKKEIKMIDPDARVGVVNGRLKKREANPFEMDWVIVNYDIIKKYETELKKQQFNVAIIDEAHYLKAVNNAGKPTSQRAEVGLKLLENIEYVFPLTGTPITKQTKDLFNILRMIRHPLGRNFFRFGTKYCDGQENRFGWDFTGASNSKELHQKIKRRMVRRLKKNVLDLPSKTRRFIPVAVPLKEYEKKVDEYMRERKSFSKTGEHLVHLNAMRILLAKEKVKHSTEIVRDRINQGDSVVVFTNYTEVVEEFQKKFKDQMVQVTGDCTGENRQLAVDQFQKGEKPLIVCNLIAGGVGITLTKAKYLIFNDLGWVASDHMQAEDRIHRVGQDGSVTIDYVYVEGAEIDERIASMLEEKAGVANAVVDEGKNEEFAVNIIDNVINSFK